MCTKTITFVFVSYPQHDRCNSEKVREVRLERFKLVAKSGKHVVKWIASVDKTMQFCHQLLNVVCCVLELRGRS